MIADLLLTRTLQNRRTFYALNKTSSVPDAKIQEIVERAVKHAPNAFNMQESRAVVVTGVTHDKLWEFIEQSYNKLFESNREFTSHQNPGLVLTTSCS
jgi:predicted oxidoreductase (fatty acid repression mutant protein)